MSLLEQLDQIDKELLLFLNGLHHPWLDQVMWYVSLKYTWIPIYLLMIFFLWKWFGKDFWKIVLGALVAVALADQFASGFCKPFFERWRPSRSPEISHLVHLINGYRGGKYGFISSHASTTFAVSFFFFLVLKSIPNKTWLRILWLFWASLVAYSRVYLGVHYVGDILAGALSGILIAWLMFLIYQYLEKRFNKTPSSPADSSSDTASTTE